MAQIESKQTLLIPASAMYDKNKVNQSDFRDAHFLKTQIPSFLNQEEESLFNSPPIPRSIAPLSPTVTKTLSEKIIFSGWNPPLNNWNSWVQSLKPRYETKWKQASIFEAIMSSTVDIKKCRSLIITLADKWNPETSTFVLPWGEISVTLEDVLQLGGCSVTGAAISTHIRSDDSVRIEKILTNVRKELNKSPAKKAGQQHWMERWQRTYHAAENVAFLALWLSRYVFPGNDYGTINKRTFPIAVQLSKGTKLALAPAVLASIYRDLRVLKEKLETSLVLGDDELKNFKRFKLSAPLQLLQVWFWERFPNLRPPQLLNNSVAKGLCRLHRWDGVSVGRNYCVGLSEGIDGGGSDFIWRPYSVSQNGCWSFDFDKVSYSRCVGVSRVVGLGCTEKYFPNRVSMQFGMDQDIPIGPIGVDENVYDVWFEDDEELYMPPKICATGVTPRYFYWFKNGVARGIMQRSLTVADDAAGPSGSKQKRVNEGQESGADDQHQKKNKLVSLELSLQVPSIDDGRNESVLGDSDRPMTALVRARGSDGAHSSSAVPKTRRQSTLSSSAGLVVAYAAVAGSSESSPIIL